MSRADAQPQGFSSSEPLWQPSDSHLALNEMGAFRRRVNQRFKLKLSDYWELHRWSTENSRDFWAFLLEDSNIPYEGALEPTFSDDAMPHTRWFENIRLNYAQGVLFPHGISPYEDAIIALTETGSKRVLSYGELREAVAACAASLRAAGVEKGDRVVAYIGNVPEAVVTLLACASIGAIFSSGSPDFGFETAKARFGQVEPKFLFASSCYFYNGKRYETLEVAQQLAEAIPSIEQIVVVPYPDDDVDLAAHDLPENTALWQDFLTKDAPLHFEMLPFDHPIYILFSSGTTGLPKAIVHRAGGAFLTHYKEQRLHSNIQKGNRVFYFTTCGWMMWNWLVSALTQGCEIVLYEGSPAYPDLTTLWKWSDELQLSFFGTSAGFIHACRNQEVVPRDFSDVSKLKTVASTGSPLSPEGFAWVYEAVKEDVHLASICGGTDIAGCFMLGVPSLPVYAGEIQAAGLGVDIVAFSEDGQVLQNEAGELVCRQPLPSMPLKFWNDAKGQRYQDSYFAYYPGIWRHGDLIEFSPHGGVIVHGRSDATLNPGGVRIGTAEIYRPLEAIPAITAAIAVGKKIEGDEVIWLFVSLQEGESLTEELQKTIKTTLRSQASPRHSPKQIFAVADLPRTRSGKLSEIAVSRIINGRDISNHSALANPEALDYIRAAIAPEAPAEVPPVPAETPVPEAVAAQAEDVLEPQDSQDLAAVQATLSTSSSKAQTASSLKALLDKSQRKHHATAVSVPSDMPSDVSGKDASGDASSEDVAATHASDEADTMDKTADKTGEKGKANVTVAPAGEHETNEADLLLDASDVDAASRREAEEWQPHAGQAFSSAVLKRHLQALKEKETDTEEGA